MVEVSREDNVMLYRRILDHIDTNFYIGHIGHDEIGRVSVKSQLPNGRKFIGSPFWSRKGGLKHSSTKFYEVFSFPEENVKCKGGITWIL